MATTVGGKPLLFFDPDDDRSPMDRWRRLTAAWRALPDFLVIGAQKSGTGSLFGYLRQHPKIARPKRREVHYFDHFHGRGLDWYRAHFPLAATMRASGFITGEATPDYIYAAGAAERIRRDLPEVRLIAILRNPTSRAISLYFHRQRKGRTDCDLAQAIERPNTRANVDPERRHPDLSDYLITGMYIEQLEKWWGLFGKNRVFVIGSEEMFREPRRVFDAATDFLGLERASRPIDFGARNVGRNNTGAPDSVRRRLDAFFAPHNARLFEALGRELDW